MISLPAMAQQYRLKTAFSAPIVPQTKATLTIHPKPRMLMAIGDLRDRRTSAELPFLTTTSMPCKASFGDGDLPHGVPSVALVPSTPTVEQVC
jgi:hypothetical protein